MCYAIRAVWYYTRFDFYFVLRPWQRHLQLQVAPRQSRFDSRLDVEFSFVRSPAAGAARSALPFLCEVKFRSGPGIGTR